MINITKTLHRHSSKSSAFTIVELLIVVVVIAILAAITLLAFSGVRQKAADAALKTDLSQAAKQLGAVNIQNGAYPGDASAVKKSDGTTFQYTYTPGTNSYCLTAASSAGEYYITSDDATPQSGVCPGHTSQNGGNPPAIVASNPNRIATGGYHTCAIDTTGHAYCWGNNNLGQLGDGTGDNNPSTAPIPVEASGVLSGKTLVSITTGNAHSCAIDSEGKAYCWGYNSYGQLGNGTGINSPSPVAVDTSGVLSGKDLIAITSNSFGTCALSSEGRAYCWGENQYGALGLNSMGNVLSPTAVDTSGVLAGKTLVSIGGSGNFCALDSDGKSYCWGSGYWGGYGNNTTDDSITPVETLATGALNGKVLESVTAGAYQSCAIDSDGLAYCWGTNSSGLLGTNNLTNSFVPIGVYTGGALAGKSLRVISAGYYNTCALDTDGKAYCWGTGYDGEVGQGVISSSVQAPAGVVSSGVLSGKNLRYIGASNYHVCAMDIDGKAYCWGSGEDGELGNGTNTDSGSPVDVDNPF